MWIFLLYNLKDDDDVWPVQTSELIPDFYNGNLKRIDLFLSVLVGVP